MIDAVDRRGTRGDPGGEDHLIELHQIRRIHKMVQPQIHARQVDHPAVVAQGFVELLFAGDLFGDIKLPTDLSQGIKERHAVPAGGGIHRKRQPGGASAHHGEPFLGDGRRDGHFRFMAGARVDETRGDFAHEDLIQTGLVAAYTGVDLIRATALRFREDLRIGEEWPCH